MPSPCALHILCSLVVSLLFYNARLIVDAEVAVSCGLLCPAPSSLSVSVEH